MLEKSLLIWWTDFWAEWWTGALQQEVKAWVGGVDDARNWSWNVWREEQEKGVDPRGIAGLGYQVYLFPGQGGHLQTKLKDLVEPGNERASKKAPMEWVIFGGGWKAWISSPGAKGLTLKGRRTTAYFQTTRKRSQIKAPSIYLNFLKFPLLHR